MNFLQKLIGPKIKELAPTIDANPDEVVIQSMTASEVISTVVGSDWGKIQQIMDMQSGSIAHLSITITVQMDSDRAKNLVKLALDIS